MTLPESGPPPALAGTRATGARPADLEVLLVHAPGALAFGETPPPPVDWESWIHASPLKSPHAIVRVNLRGNLFAASVAPGSGPRYQESVETFLLGRGRAVLVASPATQGGWLATLEAFAFLEGNLTRLEGETTRIYAGPAEGFSRLLDSPDKCERREPEHLEHVQNLQRARRELALLEPVIAGAPEDLAGHERTLFMLLAENHAIFRRLEALDDRLEVLEDQSEVVGERLLELGVARRGERVEWLIVLILLVEVLVMGVEAYLALKSYKLEARSTPASDTSGH